MTADGGVLAVNHVGISVADLAAAQRFWVDGLGAQPHGGFSWPVGTLPSDEALATTGTAAEVVLLRCDAAYLELFRFDSPPPARRSAHAPGVAGLTWAVPDVAAVSARLGGDASGEVRCPDGTPVRLVAAGTGPTGLVGVRLQVADPARHPLGEVAGPVRLQVGAGGTGRRPDPVDLGVNHVCLQVDPIGSVRAGWDDPATAVRWHQPVVSSSGGIASLCYGTSHDGVLIELLACHSPDALLSRERLLRPDG
ncbi:MAG TPA: VOC family protein [Candidatus Nanopelagicales bacterium]|nr:VOC family protein [Candidatus Nanopelagicales bacterium]